MKSKGEEKRGGLGRTEIIVALITVVGVLGGALFANWDTIFPPGKDEPTNVTSSSNATPSPSSSELHPPLQPSLDELKSRIQRTMKCLHEERPNMRIYKGFAGAFRLGFGTVWC